MKIAILSDIHGNETALKTVFDRLGSSGVDKLILLGDIIDYGPHSNEVIDILISSDLPVICNIIGNHENAIINSEYSRFSSERGKQSAEFTRSTLSDNSWNYIKNNMYGSGKYEFTVDTFKCLAVHGSLSDEYWKAIRPGDELKDYAEYDYVFSGHSHYPHFFEMYYKADRIKTRNLKKTTFINPGSVGQPRNICPFAQYAVWDTITGEINMARIKYDIKKEQQCFFSEIDSFYRDRLEAGI